MDFKDDFIGIDPGANGAIVRIRKIEKRFLLLDAHKLPYKDEKLDVRTLVRLIKALNSSPIVVEHPVPATFSFRSGSRIGSKSLFSSGLNFGRLCATIELMSSKFVTVHPREWTSQAHAGLEGDPKEKSLAVFRKLCYANSQHRAMLPRGRKDHEGIVDASLIAYFGSTRF